MLTRRALLKRTRLKHRYRGRRQNQTDQDYLDWIKLQACVATVGEHGGKTDPHHTGIRGMGQTADDNTAIPLCRNHHDRRMPYSPHTLQKQFYDFHDLDLEKILDRLRREYKEKQVAA